MSVRVRVIGYTLGVSSRVVEYSCVAYASAGNNAVSVKTRLFDLAGPISLQILHEKVFVKHSHRSFDSFTFASIMKIF